MMQKKMKKILIVSIVPYSHTNRGIDTITSYFIEKGWKVSHLVFGVNSLKRSMKTEKIKIDKFQQLFSKLSYFSYLGIMGKYFPDFLLKYIIRKTNETAKYIDFNEFNLIILETGKPLFLLNIIPKNIPLVIRVSDPIEYSFGNRRKLFEKLEKEAIERASLTLIAHEKLRKFYKKEFTNTILWKTGFDETRIIKQDVKNNDSIVYMGNTGVDYELLKYLAIKNKEIKFYIIGNHKKKKLEKNIIFLGYLDSTKYVELINKSKCFFMPFNDYEVERLKMLGMTSKFYTALTLGKAILTRKYGSIQKDNKDLNIFTYDNFEEADFKLKFILSNNFTKTKKIDEFLESLKNKNRKLELNKILIQKKII